MADFRLSGLKDNETGIALPLVLVIVFALTLLGVAVWQYSVTDTIQVVRDEKRMQAHYLARSGADAVAEFLINNPSQAANVIAKTDDVNMAEGSLGANKNFRVNVTGDPGGGITIVAEGISVDVTETLRLDLSRLSASDIFDNAIFTYSDLDVTSMKTVTGPLESAGNVDAPANYGWKVTKNSKKVYPPPVFPQSLPTGPGGPGLSIGNHETRTIEGDWWYSSISMQPNGKLIFNNNGGVQKVVVDSFNIKNDVEVVGGGRLELYITHSADIQTPLKINSGDPNKLFIFLENNCDFKIKTPNFANGFIYGPGAQVGIQANSTVKGAIIAQSVTKAENSTPSNGSVEYHPADTEIGVIPAVVSYRRGPWRD